MKKIIIIITILFCFTVCLFSKDIYDGADKETQNLLKEIDSLIEKEQYQSAFYKTSEKNEYLLTKRVEISTQYFAHSIMHQLFAFKDLKDGETLYQVRTSDGDFQMSMADPVKAIENFEKEHGEKAILKYALGLYYQDVINRYYDQWLISVDELREKVIFNFQKALDKGCYDDYSLSVLATSYYNNKDLERAVKLYQKKEKEFEFTATDNFHYGIILWMLEDGKHGIEYVKKSVEGYKEQPEYQSDAYIVVARIGMSISDFKTAEKYLAECKKAYPKDYRVAQYSITLNSLQNNKSKAIANAMELFSYAPGNPSVCQMIMEECENAGKPEFALDFFKEAVIKYASDAKACENLYFHYAYQYYYMEKPNEARQMALKAREYFTKNESLTSEVSELLDNLINVQ